MNQFVSGTQQLSGGSDAVGVDGVGNFVIAFTGPGANKTNDIFAQRFAAGGFPVGEQIGVNQYAAGSQDLAAVGMRPGGQFVVVWAGKGASDGAGVFFRQFAADGTPLGSDQRVNVTTKDTQSEPAIAIAADGRFVVAWSGRGTGDASGVFCRRFNADGTPASGEIRVNKTTSGTQSRPDVALAADGSFAVAWSGKGVGDSQGVFLQRYAADGSRIGDETRINKTTTGSQQNPDLLFDDSGGIVVVWNGQGPGDSAGIFSRRQAADGSLGAESRVNAGTTGLQRNAAIAAVGDGSYFVTWFGEHFDRGRAKGWDILSQQIDLTGQRLLTELVVNTSTKGFQSSSSVGSNRAGQVVVAWSGQGSGDTAGVFARRFAAPIDRDAPVIQIALTSDTGLSATDRLTANAAVQGQVTDASPITSLRAGFDQTAPAGFQEIALSGNSFSLSQARLAQIAGGTLADGSHVLHLQATDALGNTSAVVDFTFVLDTAAPQLAANLARDTGASDSDSITSDPTIVGLVEDRSRVTRLEATFGPATGPLSDVTDLLQVDGRFTISPGRLDTLAGSQLAIGSHVLQLRATDEHGHIATTSVEFTLQPDGIFIADLGLSAASDSQPAGDEKTNAGRVVLVGRTQPLATLTLVETGASSRANSEGLFQFPGVTLTLGPNTFTVTAANAAGETAQQQVTIERISEAGQPDPVLRWNQAALEAARQDAAVPTVASRGFAMVHAAIYDAVAAIDHSPSFLVSLPAPTGASLEAAIAGAGERVLSYLYPAQQTAFATTLATALAEVPDGSAENDGLALGHAIADAVIAIRANDGWDDYVPISTGNAPGEWQFTPPMYDPFLTPQWATLEPFSMTSPDQFRPTGPPDLTSQEYADAYNEVRLLGDASSTTRTAEQTQIARFWADGAGTFTPPGHWNQIAEQIAQSTGNSVGENARLFAMLNIALADAAIACWDAKAAYSFWRPVTAIRAGDTDGNDLTAPQADWSPLLITPPFPEYVSGHSTFSGAASTVLAAIFGDNTPFTTGSQSLPGVTRSFDTFSAAAEEAGRSRIYGGIHYQFSNQDGLATGRALAQHVLDTFSVSSDEIPPRIVIERPDADLVTKTNIVVEGRVLDNLSGVQSLEAQLDEGEFVVLTFNASGQFSLPTQFALDGSADEDHVLHLRATDAAGNVSPVVEFPFTLDTAAPAISLVSPVANSVLTAGALMNGSADGTGSDLTQLRYALDNGTSIPIPFSAEGEFSVPLDLSRLAAGQHTLVVQAQDAAGNLTAASQAFQLATPIPLALVDHTPLDGAVDLGTTFKPKITFSRPINPATLTAANFFAAGPDGQPLPTKIVVSDDHTFAWLFPQAPMPGGSKVTVHVDGSTILAASDGQPLDADDDAAPGGSLEFSFTTVSLTPLTGTTLSGKVVDPGPDLKPMTFDDMRAGPDGALYTSDDVFLLPIANAKVWIVGLEDQPVFSDAQGNFRFDAVPAGDVKLGIDGRTATGAPAGIYFPEMVMDLVIEAGRANTVMGSMGSPAERAASRDRQEVYLPRLQTSLLHTVSGNQPTIIGVDALSAPNLTPEQRSLLEIEVPPGSLVDQNGNPLASGQVGISTVPPELVREMLPPGIMQLAATLTIQAPGVATFSQPVALTFPNIYGAAPGTKLSVYSFDHTTGRLVITATATVSPSGKFATTDPASGITIPGWFGVTPPGSPGGSDGNGPPEPPAQCAAPDLPTSTTSALDLLRAEGEASQSCGIVVDDPVPLPLISTEKGALLDIPGLHWKAPLAGTLTVQIDVDGPLAEFMTQTGNLPLTSPVAFTLKAGGRKQDKALTATSKTYDEMFGKGGFASLDSDRLYGARIQVRETFKLPGQAPSREIKTFYLYRWISAVYEPDVRLKTAGGVENRSGITAAFFKTLNDGPGNWTTDKPVTLRLPQTLTTKFLLPTTAPYFQIAPVDNRGASKPTWKFDPVISGISAAYLNLQVTNPDLESLAGRPFVTDIGSISLRGTGIAPVNINVNLAGYKQELRDLLTNSTRRLELAWTPGADNAPGRARSKTFNGDDDGNGTPDDLSEYGWPGSDDEQQTVYQYGNLDITLTRAVRAIPLAGPAIGTGQTTVLAYVVDPAQVKGKHAGPDGIAGNADDASYFNVVYASDQFLQEFRDFSPRERGDPGPDRVPLTADDEFTPQQRSQLDAFLDNKVAELAAAVKADYDPADNGKNAYRFVDTGGDVQMKWCDPFITARDGRACGADKSGDPIYGFADFDADTTTDRNADGIFLEPVLHDERAPLVAKDWALAEEMNTKVAAAGTFGIAINISFNNPLIAFAQFVANSVSHEVGHTFGINDAYLDPPFKGLPGTAGCRLPKSNRCIPYDIMQPGSIHDGDLAFGLDNTQILQAAMGIAPYGSLANAVRMYRRTFNLADSATGVRPQFDPMDDLGRPLNVPGEPLPIATAGAQAWYDNGDGPTLDMGEAPADGPGGQSQSAPITIINAGSAPLSITGFQFNQPGPFEVVDPDQVLTTPVEPGDSAQITVRFDPSQPDVFNRFLEIASNVADGTVIRVPLQGRAFAASATVHVDLVGVNNLGGVEVGNSADNSEVFQVTNAGNQPLLINGIDLGEGQGTFSLLGVPADLATQPISLARGESFTFGANFRPDKLGLSRGIVEMHTNDPTQPVLRLSVVGTGVASIPTAQWGNDYVAMRMPLLAGAPPLHARSDDKGNFEFFLPAQATYELSVFDPQTGLIGVESGTTESSGQRTTLASTLVFGASTSPDSDFDGLPDDIEFAVGTSENRVDSDGDGLDDFAEIAGGLNPLDGRPVATGVVGALGIEGGEARDVALAADVNDSSKVTAYVAGGSAGLAIADVSQFDRPVWLGRLALPGTSVDVDLDTQRQLAAVASGDGGLHLVDISDPTQPRLRRTFPVNSSHVELFEDAVYASVTTGFVDDIRAFDVISGDVVARLPLAQGQVQALARSGSILFAITTAGTQATLQALDISGEEIVPRGSLALPLAATKLTVADGVAWIVSDVAQMTVDVSDPDNLRLINASIDDVTDRTGTDLALNGSGLGVIAGMLGSLGSARPAAYVIQANDSALRGNVVASYFLPAVPQSVAISSGLAYVADGSSGLQIVNFLPFDTGTSPPELTVRLLNADSDASRPGIQLPEATTVVLAATVSDDVQVRNVELLVNGVVVRNEISYPFELSTILPTIASGGNSATLQVRATDTGGNTRLSDPIVIEAVPDPTPPTIIRLNPADGSTTPSFLRSITIDFSEPLDPTTLQAADFELRGPGGVVPPSSLRVRLNDQRVVLSYLALADGDYQLVIHAAAITDRVGLALGAGDIVSTFHVGAIGPPVAAEVQAGLRTAAISRESVGQLQGVGDFNRDGILDVAYAGGNLNGGTPFVIVLLGKGDGSFQWSLNALTLNSETEHVITADLNNDGILDLAAAQPFDDDVATFLGNGDGTFQPAILTASYKAAFLAAGDFNGDGKVDLAAGEGAAGSLNVGGAASILLGNGDGTFSTSGDQERNPDPFLSRFSGLNAADMDGDGKLDLVFVSGQTRKIQVALGRGDGTFPIDQSTGYTAAVEALLPAGAKLAAIADFSGDGKLDAAVTGDSGISILIGKGDGSFLPPVIYDAANPQDVTAADYNGDGRIDLIVSNPGTDFTGRSVDARGNLYVLVNQGAGFFAPATPVLGIAWPGRLASGDFDKDGRMDVVATIASLGASGGVTVLRGNGAGGLLSAQRFTSGLVPNPAYNGFSPFDVARTADINNDGKPDVILSDRPGNVHVGLGNGDGTFQPLLTSPALATSFGTAEVALGDINNDGILDFALANPGSDSVDVALGNGDGTFQSRRVINFPPPSGFAHLVTDVELADLDNDGNLDLVVGYGIRPVVRLRGFGNGTFAVLTSDSYVSLPIAASGYQIKVGDYNNDGILDIAALQLSVAANVPSPVRILLGLGDLNFSLNVVTLDAPTTTFGLTAADVNRDGNLDLITASEAFLNYGKPGLAQGGVLSVFISRGDGTFAAAVPYGDHIFGYADVLATDVNGDGYPDLVASTSPTSFVHVVASQQSSGLAVLLNKGDGTFGSATYFDHGGTTTGWLAAADFNRDGRIDILVPNAFDDSFSILFAGPPLPPLAAPLRAAGGPAAAFDSEVELHPLASQELAAIVDAALARWADTGLSSGELDRLRDVQWSVANLNGDYLGLSTRNTIALDVNAAGFGWFVDPTPAADEEYVDLLASDSLRAASQSPAAEEMDLLTVVLHELGHVLGLEHDDASQSSQPLMFSTLPAGLRRLPRRM